MTALGLLGVVTWAIGLGAHVFAHDSTGLVDFAMAGGMIIVFFDTLTERLK